MPKPGSTGNAIKAEGAEGGAETDLAPVHRGRLLGDGRSLEQEQEQDQGQGEGGQGEAPPGDRARSPADRQEEAVAEEELMTGRGGGTSCRDTEIFHDAEVFDLEAADAVSVTELRPAR